MKLSQIKFLIDQALTAALVNQRNTIYGKKYLLNEESKIFFYEFIVVKLWDFFFHRSYPVFSLYTVNNFAQVVNSVLRYLERKVNSPLDFLDLLRKP